MSETPLLTVIIPAFNAGAFVREAIESVLENGFSDLELLVIDDGSTDNTAEVVAAIRHPALRYERNVGNQGVGLVRRRAVELSRGRLLAMLDADDVAVRGRFDAQVHRLETAGGPDIIGGGIEFFGEFSGTVEFPSEDSQIRAGMPFFDLPIANGTASMKAQPLRDGIAVYGAMGGAEDYALWADALVAGLRFENLPVVATRVRRHAASLTRSAGGLVFAEGCNVRRRVIGHLFPALAPAESAALVSALSLNLGGGQRWIDGVCAMAHTVRLAAEAPGIDVDYYLTRLESNLMRLIEHARNSGAIDNEDLEMITEKNADFEQWRNARHGALDMRIVTLFA